jgi:hypothetical protein
MEAFQRDRRPGPIVSYGSCSWSKSPAGSGVTWSAADENHITAYHRLGSTAVEIDLTLDAAGRIRSVVFDRWGDPDQTGSWAWYPFGGEITGYRSFAGLTIPNAGRLGWYFGTGRWAAGEFFRYEITSLQIPSPDGTAAA